MTDTRAADFAVDETADRRPDTAEAPGKPNALLALHRQIGNRAFGRLSARGAVATADALVHSASIERNPRQLVARELLQRSPAPPTSVPWIVDARWAVSLDQVPADLASQLLANPSIAMTCYEAYATGSANDAEFKWAATDFAKEYSTFGLVPGAQGGKLVQGAPTPVRNRQDVQQAIAAIEAISLLLVMTHSQDGQPAPTTLPRIGTLAVFAHGVRGALGLDPQGETGTHWFRASEIGDFVAAIRPFVSPDVRVLLFACSTGRGDHESFGMPPADEAGGKGSFAAQLANALGGGATVYAHDVAGHTESNPYARVFTAGSDTGQDVFNAIYSAAFIDSEVARLNSDKADLVTGVDDDKLRAGLRKAMWQHYIDAVSADFKRARKDRHFAIGGYGGVGAAMFMDVAGTTATLRTDFSTVWLTDARIRALGK